MRFSKKQLKEMKYFAEYIIVLPVLFILKLLSLEGKNAFAKIIGKYVMYPFLKHFFKKRYNIISKNLEIVYRRKISQNENDNLIKQYCSHFIRTFVEGLSQKQMTKDWLLKNVETKNLNILLDAHKNGEKIILTSAHIGSWEIAHKYLYEVHNIKTTIVYKKQNNTRIDNIYSHKRTHANLIEKTDKSALKKMVQDLIKGNIVIILLDQRNEDEEIIFFEKSAWFPTSIAKLAIKHNAKVICGYCHRNDNYLDTGSKKFTFEFENIIPITENSTKKSLTQEIFNYFQTWIEKYPTQWFCLIQDIWRERPFVINHNHILNKYQNIVIKIGSNTLMYLFENNLFESFVYDIIKLHKSGKTLTIVTSGAIATARKHLNIEKPTEISQKQALSSIGQVMLMNKYYQEFEKHQIKVGQILVTNNDISTPDHLANLKSTITALRNLNTIPVLNENDAISTDEIKIGDNDTLSAHIANIVDASLLIILTDVNGVYDSNPNFNSNAKLITKTNGLEEQAQETNTEFGTGGIATKIKAGNIAIQNNFDAIITNGRKFSPILSIKNDECTLFAKLL